MISVSQKQPASGPFVVHGLEERPESIMKIWCKAPGQIAPGLRIAWVVKASPFAIFRDVLGDPRKFVGCRMFRQYR